MNDAAPSPSTLPDKALPLAALYSTRELQQFALHHALLSAGIADPVRFLAENDVETVAAFRHDIGLAITIIRSTPKPSKKA